MIVLSPILENILPFALADERQRFCLIIPVRNEARTLTPLLVALHERLPLNADEVILVLNGCTDDSDLVLDRAFPRWRHPAQLTRLQAKEAGKASAISLGLAHAKSPYAVLWDADLEYGFAALPLIAQTLASDTLITGCRPLHALKWRSVLANALARLALRTAGSPPADVLTGIHAARTDWLRSSLLRSKARGYELEVAITRSALVDRLYQLDIAVPYRPRSFKDGRGIRWYHLFPILKAALGINVEVCAVATPQSNHASKVMPYIDRSSLLERVFIASLSQMRFQIPGLRKGIEAAAWRKGNRVYISEMRFREEINRIMQSINTDEVAAWRGGNKPGEIAQQTWDMLGMLRKKGWLVEDIEGIEAYPPLWTIRSGTINFSGIIIVDLPDSLTTRLAKNAPYEITVLKTHFPPTAGNLDIFPLAKRPGERTCNMSLKTPSPDQGSALWRPSPPGSRFSREPMKIIDFKAESSK